MLQNRLDRARSRLREPPARSHRIAAVYGLLFLLAVVAAPHHHLNSFDDLVSDGPSNSGILVLQSATDSDPSISVLIEVDDDPCLACFHHDYAAATSYVFLALRESRSFPLTFVSVDPSVPQSVSNSLASRSPPRAAPLS